MPRFWREGRARLFWAAGLISVTRRETADSLSFWRAGNPGFRISSRHASQTLSFSGQKQIISGLSDVTVVVEARKRSGSLITAGFAADQGKDVYAVPGRPGESLSEGCNELISQGANLFLSSESFLRAFFPEKTRQKKWRKEDLTLAPAEKLVYSSFDLHSKTLWELAECTGLSLSELGSSLLSLEEKGYIRETGQNTFAVAAWPGSS